MYAIWMSLDEVFAWVARTSLYAVAVIAVIILTQLLTRRLLSAKLSYALWVVLLLRLVIPTGLESGLTLIFHRVSTAGAQSGMSTALRL